MFEQCSSCWVFVILVAMDIDYNLCVLQGQLSEMSGQYKLTNILREEPGALIVLLMNRHHMHAVIVFL